MVEMISDDELVDWAIKLSTEIGERLGTEGANYPRAVAVALGIVLGKCYNNTDKLLLLLMEDMKGGVESIAKAAAMKEARKETLQ